MTGHDTDTAAPGSAKLAELRAIAHPVRLRILSLVTGAALNATEVADQLGLTQANASYHLRLLERAGLVTVVEEVRIRGGRSRRYRHVPDTAGEECDPGAQPEVQSARAGLDRVLAAELIRRGGQRTSGPATMTDAELWVTPAAWQTCVAALTQVATDLHLAASGPGTAGTQRVSLTIDAFVMTSGDRGTGPAAGLP